MTTYLTAEASLEIVAMLGVGPVRDEGLLVSAIGRPGATLFGADAYPGLEGKAAVLLESIVRNHPLVDGNKRFGWVATVVFLGLNGVRLEAPTDGAFDLVVGVAAGRLDAAAIGDALGEWMHEGRWSRRDPGSRLGTATAKRDSARPEHMTSPGIPSVQLNDGTSIPQLGFGVFRVIPDECERVVSDALAVGYRHIDTASIYGNERAVGRAIAASGIPRDELYITTKLWNDEHGRDRVSPALDASLERLGLDHVDLYLIHWPAAANGRHVETWEAMLDLPGSGRTTSVGVCNFLMEPLRDILEATSVAPVVDQIEQHPYLQQPELDALIREHNIRTEAWGPLAQGKTGLLDEPAVLAVAAAHDKTPAQAVIRWHLDQGNILFPKTVSRDRMIENLGVFDFELTPDEFAAISALDRGEPGRVGSHPDKWN